MKDGTQARRRVLICDDEEGVRESLKLILEDEYELFFASNGAEAVEMMQKFHFDAAILDVKMPRMGGLEALRTAKKANPRLRAILISAYKVSSERDVDFIEKPFSAQDVLRAVKGAIGKDQPS